MREKYRYRAHLTSKQRACAIAGHVMMYVQSRFGRVVGIIYVETKCTECGFLWTFTYTKPSIQSKFQTGDFVIPRNKTKRKDDTK